MATIEWDLPKKPRVEWDEPKYDPTEGMSGGQKFLAGVGKGMVDLGRGVGQMFGMVSEDDVKRSRQLDAPLMKTGAGLAGNIVGAAVPAMATMLIPGVNTYTGAAAVGAGMGALNPIADGETRLGNAVLGGVGGVAGQFGANMVGRAIAPVKNALTGEQQRLAAEAVKRGIPLDAADVTGSKPLKAIRSVMGNLPLTAGRQAEMEGAKQAAFNRAVLRTAGENADNAAPEVVKDMMDRLGGNFQNIYGRNSVKVDNNLLTALADVDAKYGRVLPSQQKEVFNRVIDDILANPSMQGQTYQFTRTQMGKLSKSGDPAVAQAAAGIKEALDDAAARSLNPADATLLKQTQRQYANAKAIENAMSTVPGVSGDIPAANLRTALKTQSKKAYTQGQGDLNDLSRIGATFLRDPMANTSNTATHGLYQNLLTGGALAGLGAGVGYGGSGGDLQTAGLLAAGGLLSPRIAQAALYSPIVQQYLASGAARQAIGAGAQRVASPALTGVGAAGLLSYFDQ